jgi:pimeloyl-ACP methyl ester carboxylesterase
MLRRFARCLALVCLAWAWVGDSGAQPASIAIIALHGKWGKPPGPLAAELQAAGYHVVSPAMPWGRDRLYDVDYPSALLEIRDEVARLRAQGFARVVLSGHSLGANAALAYAASHGDVDALMVFAPGHVPEWQFRNGDTAATLQKARTLVQAGQGDARDFEFTDFNSGNRRRQLVASAAVYLSYYEPAGLANMAVSAKRVSTAIPVFYAGTTQDGITRWGNGAQYAFAQLPVHPQSVYLESRATHMEVPQDVVAQSLGFLKSLWP